MPSILEPQDTGREKTRTIVFVNSLATTRQMWDGVLAALPDEYRTLCYEQRDRRGSTTEGGFELDDLVADLFRTMDEAGVVRAHVVGVSLGGMVGLRAASLRPDRVTSLTAMCCAARFPSDVWIARGRAVRANGLDPIVPGVIDRWFTREFQLENPAVVSSFRAMLASTDPTGYAQACDLLASSDVRRDLASISVPTLVVSGESDTANPVRDQVQIAEAVPGAQHVVLPSTAHLAPASDPAGVAHLIHQHVRGAEQR